MSKSKSIIILGIILLLLCGSYFYVSENVNTGSTSIGTGIVKMWDVDKTKISKIIISGSSGESRFVKNTGDWSMENYNYKLDQTAITNVTDLVINLSGTLVEKNAKNTEQYGFNKPSISLKIVGDGSEKTILIGEKSSDGSNYYANEKDSGNVYFIEADTVKKIITKQSAYRDKTINTIDLTTLSYIKISKIGSLPIEIIKNTNRSEAEIQTNANLKIITKPYSTQVLVDDQKFASITATMGNLKVSEVVEDSPKDLSLYGLDKPSLELTLTDSENTLHFLIGKNKDDRTTYFKIDNDDSVYSMSTILIDAFTFKPFDIINKFVYSVNMDDVDKIVLDEKGIKNTIVLSRTLTKAEKSGNPDFLTTTSKVNDKSIGIEKFTTLYKEFIGLQVDAENDKKLEDKPEVSIIYSLNKGSNKEEVVDFIPYNDQFYAVFRNGKSDFLIEKYKINGLITDFKKLK